MTLMAMAWAEIRRRRGNFLLGAFSCALAVLGFSLAGEALRRHDVATIALLAEREAGLARRLDSLHRDTLAAMRRVGHDWVLLPAAQSLSAWHLDGCGDQAVPEAEVVRLADGLEGLLRSLTPGLRQRLAWPGAGLVVIVAGLGDAPLAPAPAGEAPSLDVPPAGMADLGHALALRLGIGPGARIELGGRALSVRRIRAEEAAAADMTVFLSLRDAQAVLGRQGQVNAILAMGTRQAAADPDRLRAVLAQRLPGLQAVVRSPHTLARLAAVGETERQGREAIAQEAASRRQLRAAEARLLMALVPLLVVVCVGWVTWVVAANLGRRRTEIGILRAVGVPGRSVTLLLAVRPLAMGLTGGGGALTVAAAMGGFRTPGQGAMALALAMIVAVAGSLVPVAWALAADPAATLRGDGT